MNRHGVGSIKTHGNNSVSASFWYVKYEVISYNICMRTFRKFTVRYYFNSEIDLTCKILLD